MAACDAAGNVVNEDELQFEEKHHGVFQDPPPPVANDHHAAGENAASAAAANDARLDALNARPAPVRQNFERSQCSNIDFSETGTNSSLSTETILRSRPGCWLL